MITVKALITLLLQDHTAPSGAVWSASTLLRSNTVDFDNNDPKFLEKQVWANSVDPDQIAPLGAVWSGSMLFAIPSASFGHITL